MNLARCFAIAIVISIWSAQYAEASVGSSILKALTKFGTKEGGQEAAEKIAKEVGEDLAERTAQKVLREGGEQSLTKVSNIVADHGPDVVRALDNAPTVAPILKALDEIPANEIAAASTRLAAGKAGQELAALTARYGSSALRAEVVHPGVGQAFVGALGDDGASLCLKLTKDQAIEIGKHLSDMAVIPPGPRSQIVALISSNADRFATFVGRFVEKNPGKILFTAATTTLILAESERFLGGDEIAYSEDGTPYVLHKPGVIGSVANQVGTSVVQPIMRAIMWVAVPALAVFASIKLWGIWRRENHGTRFASRNKKLDET